MAVRVWVRGQEGIRALYDQRPPEVAITLAEEALAIGAPQYAGKAMAAMAQGYALQGRAEEARDWLQQIQPETWEGTAASLGGHKTIYGWDEVNYWHTASYVTSHIGDLKAASRAQNEALSRYSPKDQRQRALVQLHRAMCAVREGNIEDGVQHARRVIEALSQRQRTATVVQTGQQVIAALPESERNRVVAREFRELLALPAVPGGV